MNKTLRRAVLIGCIQAAWLLCGFTLLTTLLPQVPRASLRATTGLLGMLVLLGGIGFAMRQARREAEGDFTYLQAMRAGLVVSGVVAVTVSLASLLYVTVLSPGFAARMIDEAVANARAVGASPEEVERARRSAAREFSTAAQVLMPLVAQTVAGAFFSSILAVFFRQKRAAGRQLV